MPVFRKQSCQIQNTRAARRNQARQTRKKSAFQNAVCSVLSVWLICMQIWIVLNLRRQGLLSERFLMPCGMAAVLADGILITWLFGAQARSTAYRLAVVCACCACAGCSMAGFWLHQHPMTNPGVSSPERVLVISLADSPALCTSDLQEQKVGILKNINRRGTNQAIDRLKEELTSFSLQEYPSFSELAQALQQGQVRALILNEKFLTEEDLFKPAAYIVLLEVELE